MKISKVSLIALIGLSFMLVMMNTAQAATAPPTNNIESYSMQTFTATNANGTVAKTLAPEQDMNYPENCSLYLVVANFGGSSLQVLMGNTTLSTVNADDMQLVSFETPASGQAFSISIVYQAPRSSRYRT